VADNIGDYVGNDISGGKRGAVNDIIPHRFWTKVVSGRGALITPGGCHVFLVLWQNRHFPGRYSTGIGGVPILLWVVRWESLDRTVDSGWSWRRSMAQGPTINLNTFQRFRGYFIDWVAELAILLTKY